MEHLAIRTSKFLPKGQTHKMRLYDVGYVNNFTQSRIKHPQFKEGQINKGETVWLAESGYGVIAKCEINNNPETFEIRNMEDLEKFKMSSHPNLISDERYWIYENKKVTEAMKVNKSRFIIRIPYVVVETDFDHFPIDRPQGAMNSWIFLDKNPEYFKYRYNKTVQEYLLERSKGRRGDKIYTGITSDVRNKISLIWGNFTFDGKIYGDVNGELDHVIPQSLLGAGIIHENIVPIDGLFNVRMNNRIPFAFFKVLQMFDHNLISNEITIEFHDYFEKDSFILKLPIKVPNHHQRALITPVMRDLRNKHVDEQRKFYLAVAILFYGKIVWDKYIKGTHSSIKLDNIENDEFIKSILEIVEKEEYLKS